MVFLLSAALKSNETVDQKVSSVSDYEMQLRRSVDCGFSVAIFLPDV